MNPRLLIDGIVRQTTVLIAQLSTAAGIRAPLAHVADQVFLSLANEIEAQGVGRKVVADMFGLALRTYQKKVQRLTESSSERGRTLWEAMLEFIQDNGSVTRARLLARFKNDEERVVIGVLGDLVSSGLVYSSGRGERTVYGITSDADRSQIDDSDDLEGMAHAVWTSVYNDPGTTTERLLRTLPVDEEVLREALGLLLADGRVTREGEGDSVPLHADRLIIPVGAQQGWEAAVYDHYCAVATAIAAKVRAGAARAKAEQPMGGATLRFELSADHPYAKQVYGLLERVRGDVNALWDAVSAHNKMHPIPEEERIGVCFYFGQSVKAPGETPGDRELAQWGDEGSPSAQDTEQEIDS